MLDEQNLDVLVVTTVDATHDEYIIPALHKGIKVLTEKPMTTYVCCCSRILPRGKSADEVAMWRSARRSSRPSTRPRDLFKVSLILLEAVRVANADVALVVLFNYRYNPCHWKIEEVISSGKIGNVKSVHFEWLLVS